MTASACFMARRSGVLARSVAVVLLGSLPAVVGCRQDDDRSAASVNASPSTPAETVESLRAWHARGAYLAIRPHIDPAARGDLIDLLMAVDELLAANRRACRTIEASSPGADVSMFDMSPAKRALGLFAPDVQVAGIEESGPEAKVHLRIPGQARLVQVRLERREGLWVYMPGPTSPEMVAGLRELAAAWDRIALVVGSGGHTREEIADIARRHLTPGLQALASHASSEAAP